GRGGPDRHLLTENRAQSHLESAEGAGDTQTRVRRDGTCQPRVLLEVCRNEVGPGIEIEKRAHTREQCGQDGRQALRELDHEARLALRAGDLDPASRLSEPDSPG